MGRFVNFRKKALHRPYLLLLGMGTGISLRRFGLPKAPIESRSSYPLAHMTLAVL